MPPAFLNSREDALLIWTLLILGFLFYKDPRGMTSTFWDLGFAAFSPKLMLVFGSAVAYSAGIVIAADRVGAWHTTSVKETIYWFVGVALVLLGRAVNATPGRDYLREIVRRAVALTIVVEFVTTFYVFPLAIELPLVFVALVLTMWSEVPAGFQGTDPRISIVVGRALVVLGLLALATFGLRAILDPGHLFTVDTAERFLIVPVFTLALTPYLFAVAWYFRREESRLRQRFARDYLVGIEKA
jgi:hypothetical protein